MSCLIMKLRVETYFKNNNFVLSLFPTRILNKFKRDNLRIQKN